MKKTLLLMGCLAAAMSSVADNGITWEGPYAPFSKHTSQCEKGDSILIYHPRVLSECPLTSVDTVIVSDQSEDINECAHYKYTKKFYVVAKDECGNTDSLFLGAEIYNYQTILSDTSALYYNNNIVLGGITPDVEPTFTLTALPVIKNCIFTMPNVEDMVVIEYPKCGGYLGPIKKTQSIAPGEVLEEGRTYDSYLTISDACKTIGEFKIKTEVPTRKSILSIIAPESTVVNANEDLNLTKVFDVKGTTQVTDLDGSLIEIPSSLYSDYYRGRVYEDSLIFSNNPKTYASEYLIPERLTLKSEKDNGIYALVAMDTVSGCSDTAYTNIIVEAKEGIIWTNRPEPNEITVNPCKQIVFTENPGTEANLTYVLLPKDEFIAKSSCSGVNYDYFNESDQDPLKTSCGHYNYDIRSYKVATDSCGNSDTILALITHVRRPPLIVSNELMSAAPEYLGNCEFAVPELTHNPTFYQYNSCIEDLRVSQSIAPGTRITEETNVSIFFADACDSIFAYNINIPVGKPEDIKILVDTFISVKAGVEFNNADNIFNQFRATSSHWINGWNGELTKVPSQIFKSIYGPDGVELVYPYILNGIENEGTYTFIATDSTTGCSDTALAYVYVDTLIASSPVILAELSETKVDIYTPSGILLKKNVYFKDVMAELKAGIYIVNNKKYFLKK